MPTFDDLMLVTSLAAIVFPSILVIFVSMRSYGRTKSGSMLALSIGFAVIVMASLTEESLVELFGYPMIEAHFVENFIVALGPLLIVYPIYKTPR